MMQQQQQQRIRDSNNQNISLTAEGQRVTADCAELDQLFVKTICKQK
jgi:hypothetical protein